MHRLPGWDHEAFRGHWDCDEPDPEPGISVQVFHNSFPQPTFHLEWGSVLEIIERFGLDWKVLISMGSQDVEVDILQIPTADELATGYGPRFMTR